KPPHPAIPRVSHIDITVTSGDGQRTVELAGFRTGLPPGEQQVAARVELLDAVVAGVGDEDGARFADRDPLRPAEPPRLLAETAPAAEWLALRANLVDRVLLEDCQIERAVWPRRDARRNVEYRLAVRPSNGRQLNAVRPENGHRMA